MPSYIIHKGNILYLFPKDLHAQSKTKNFKEISARDFRDFQIMAEAQVIIFVADLNKKKVLKSYY